MSVSVFDAILHNDLAMSVSDPNCIVTYNGDDLTGMILGNDMLCKFTFESIHLGVDGDWVASIINETGDQYGLSELDLKSLIAQGRLSVFHKDITMQWGR